MKKRTYQAVGVQQVRVADLAAQVAGGCIVALDVAKQKFVVAIATGCGEVLRLFRFEHPTETRAFLTLVAELRAVVTTGVLKAVMEPTGTYGDAIRHQLTSAGVSVWMVSPKRTHDSHELFDNVPSLHDGKSAVLIAKLCAMNLATEWKPVSAARARARVLVELRQHEQRREEMCMGRLEALLARHWPEYGAWMDVRQQKSALRLLAAYGGPVTAGKAPDQLAAFLDGASRKRLSRETIDGVTRSARTTLGAPMLDDEVVHVKTLAAQALASRLIVESLDEQLRKLGESDETLARLQSWMGAYTAAVVTTLCDPREYARAGQLEKACGLNLREKSSGQHQGRMSITKRGPGLVRQVLYLFALRMIQDSAAVRCWYMRRRGYTEHSRQAAVVAVMRKLVGAIFHVARGADFDPAKLFDMRRLDVNATPRPKRKTLTPRTTSRSIARTPKRRQTTEVHT